MQGRAQQLRQFGAAQLGGSWLRADPRGLRAVNPQSAVWRRPVILDGRRAIR